MFNKSATDNHHFFKGTIAQRKTELHINKKHNDTGIGAITLEMFMQFGKELEHNKKPRNVARESPKNKPKNSPC